MSPQLQTLLLNYAKRFTTWITWAAGIGAAAFYAQDAATQLAQIKSLGFSPVWIPLATLVIHAGLGAVMQSGSLAPQPVPAPTPAPAPPVT